PGRGALYHSARRPGARPGRYNPSHFPGCMPMAVRWFLLLFLACAQAAEARMYQWIDPDTRTTQLSGKPPTWYRSPEGGPRVLVFERGRMVDDTARPVSESERQRLREEALVRAEQDQAAIEARLAEARRMQLLLRERAAEEEFDLEPVAVKAQPLPTRGRGESDDTMEAMRALVEKWDELRAARARQMLDQAEEQPATRP